MQSEQIKPYFHYTCEREVMALDCQYSPSGNSLALSFSNGSIQIYASSKYMNTQQAQKKSQSKFSAINHIYLKLSWSYNDNILAAGSINKEISIFKVNEHKIQYFKSVKTIYIPVFLCYYPSYDFSILTVGFAGGAISLYDEKISEISCQVSHRESVNWLSWESQLQESEKNGWVKEYYPNCERKKQNNKFLVSGSSDKHIKIWKLNSKMELQQIYSFQAHSKEIRQVMWKPNYFQNDKKIFVSCSQDGNVKFWTVSLDKSKIIVNQSFFKTFNGPVYRAEYNHLGTVIAIRYFEIQQVKISTKIFKQVGGLLKQEIFINGDEKQL